MAKSKSFFGLRRGSTKSHTYSILNGQQITKDRVQTVANPKTQKQQFQRAIMATVMAAYSEMKEIEDHAFQGKKKGSENQREFMSRNLVAMRNAFLQYQSEQTASADQKFFAVGPKTPTVLPCEWILSHGTLEEQSFLTYENGNHTFVTAEILSAHPQSDGLSISLGDFSADMGLVPGMQITFVCVNASNGPRIYQVDPAAYGGYHDFKFRVARYVVGNYDPAEVVAVATTSRYDLFKACLAKITDLNRTSPNLYASLRDDTVFESNEGFGTVDAELLLDEAKFDETLTRGLGIITSMVDGPERSTSKMLVRPWVVNDPSIGLGWQFVPLAWQQGGEALGESDLYLEGGE